MVGCAARSPVERFREYRPLTEIPERLKETGKSPEKVRAKISLRAPGLRGTASGIIRHARDGQYLVELYGRGELFLRVYFTDTQTVLWPAVGMPEFFAPDETPTLRQSVHELLPAWRLDDVLPVVMSEHSAMVSRWSADRNKILQVIERNGYDPLWKAYSRVSADTEFPFRKVALYSESGRSRLTWILDNAPETAPNE